MQAIKLQLNDEINIDESRKHLTNLHKGSEGYITVASKSPDYSQWHYKREDLLERTEDIINDIMHMYLKILFIGHKEELRI